jgi:hypothetical protein
MLRTQCTSSEQSRPVQTLHTDTVPLDPKSSSWTAKAKSHLCHSTRCRNARVWLKRERPYQNVLPSTRTILTCDCLKRLHAFGSHGCSHAQCIMPGRQILTRVRVGVDGIVLFSQFYVHTCVNSRIHIVMVIPWHPYCVLVGVTR